MNKKLQIFLNDKLIDVEMDEIQSFKDFFEDLKKSLLENNLVINELKINSKVIDVSNLPDYDLENIEKIEVKADDINVIVVNTLGDMVDYVYKFLSAVEDLCTSINFDDIQQYVPTFLKIISGLEWIFTGLRSCENAMRVQYSDIKIGEVSISQKIEEYESQLNLFKSSVISVNVKKIKDHLFNNLCNILRGLTDIIKKLFDIFKDTHFTSEELAEQIKLFQGEFLKRPKIYEGISEKIQTGEEVDGIELFKKEILFFENWVSFLKKLEKTFCNITMKMFVNEKSIFEHNNDFMAKMTELTEAFENEDYILISDIIEYEIREYIDIYLEFLKELNEQIFGNTE